MDSPVLSRDKFQRLLALDDTDYAHQRIDLNVSHETDLKSAIENICDQAVAAIKAGKVIVVLSDRGIAKDKLPVHALLATGAVHHRLIAEGLRCDANIMVETGTARDSHHCAVLLGYGATAIYPYLAFECIHDLIRSGEIKGIAASKAAENYRKGINKGLYKITSKMGISTIALETNRALQDYITFRLPEEKVEGIPRSPDILTARRDPVFPPCRIECRLTGMQHLAHGYARSKDSQVPGPRASVDPDRQQHK